MTLDQSINAFDQLQPNAFTRAEKLRWLAELDGQVWQEILRWRGQASPVPVYDEDTPGDTVLAIPEPYCGIYTVYLAMQADRLNGEIARYNNDAALFHSQMQSFRAHWMRTNAPAPAVNLTL